MQSVCRQKKTDVLAPDQQFSVDLSQLQMPSAHVTRPAIVNRIAAATIGDRIKRPRGRIQRGQDGNSDPRQKHDRRVMVHVGILYVQLFYETRIFLNVLETQFGFFAHQTFDQICCFAWLIFINGHADQFTRFGIHCCFF